MELKVIGTGSSGNAYILRHNKRMLLLDCGTSVDSLYRGLGYDLGSLDGCLLSHNHADHSKSAAYLQSQYVKFGWNEENKCQHFGDWAFIPFAVEHDVSNYAYIIQNRQAMEHKLAYITDTGYVRYNPQGISTYIIECNFIDELLKADTDRLQEEGERYLRSYEYHMSLKRLLSFLGKADLSKLVNVVLVHLSDRYSDEEVMIAEVKKLTGVQVYAAHAGDLINLEAVPF
jgi:phosphoribosyl 1,2-cyclic phosphodiesterase